MGDKLSYAAVEELNALRDLGKLTPPGVLAFAKDPKTALHRYFTWDDSAAAYQYRLTQARGLIVEVRVETPKATKIPRTQEVRINTIPRRSTPPREVRHIAVKTETKLDKALAELKSFRSRYPEIKELAPVHKAIDQVLLQNADPKKRHLLEAVQYVGHLEEEGYVRSQALSNASTKFNIPYSMLAEEFRKVI